MTREQRINWLKNKIAECEHDIAAGRTTHSPASYVRKGKWEYGTRQQRTINACHRALKDMGEAS
jgi:hypothetical protein